MEQMARPIVGSMADRYCILCLVFCTVATSVAAQPLHMALDEVLELGLPVVEVVTVDSIEPTAERIEAPDYCPVGRSITNATKVPGRLAVWEADGRLRYESLLYRKERSGMTIKIRGNNSGLWTPPPYKVKLEKKADLLGRGDETKYADKHWLLLREWRQTLNIPIGLKVNELLGLSWTPACEHVNLLMNGKYRGVYLLTEQVRRNPRCRIDVDKETGFIVERDIYWWNEPVSFETTMVNTFWQRFTFKYPDEDEVTDAQVAAAQAAVNRMEAAIADGTYDEFIDVRSFAAWHLGHDILGTYDCSGANQFYSKRDDTDDSRITLGPLWDFDTNFYQQDEWSRFHDSGSYLQPLLKSPNKAFAKALVRRWEELSPILVERMMVYLDSLEASPAGQGITRSRQLLRPTSYVSTHENVEEAREWFSTRKEWLDVHIAEIDTMDASPVAAPNEEREDGAIYDLAGRRWPAHQRKELPTGVYILNAKKVRVIQQSAVRTQGKG